MMSTPVPPFYDSGRVPPPIPLLSGQTPLLCSPAWVSLVASEELRPNPRRRSGPTSTSSVAASHLPSSPFSSTRTKSRLSTPRHPTPSRGLDDGARVKSRATTPSKGDPPLFDEDSDLSPLSDDSEEVDDSIQKLIPKPPGTPGRPDSGGYNLAVAMGWSPTAFKQLQVRIISSHLVLVLCLINISETGS